MNFTSSTPFWDFMALIRFFIFSFGPDTTRISKHLSVLAKCECRNARIKGSWLCLISDRPAPAFKL